MNLKRIIQRGGGYARRRDRSFHGSTKQFTPSQKADFQKITENLPGIFFWFIMFGLALAFLLLGIEVGYTKLMEHITGVE
jgi:hypothetical protein